MTKSRDTANIIKQPFTQTLGTSNYRAGVNAGNSITSGGNYNVTVGDEAGTAITTGDYNTAVGMDSAKAITTGIKNTAIGSTALDAEVAGNYSTAIGMGALTTQSQSGDVDVYNTAVGYLAGGAVTTGKENTFIGGLAGDAITTSNYNTALGSGSLGADDLGSFSTAIGRGTLANQNYASATNSFNTAVGANAGEQITTGIENTIIGALAGDALTDADYNIVVGTSALSADTLGSRSIAIGYKALEAQNFTSATDTYNVAIGHFAGGSITTGFANTAVGGLALDANQTSNSNTAVGKEAGTSTTQAAGTYIGAEAGKNTNSVSNTFIGCSAGEAVTSAAKNTILGRFNGNENGLDIRTSSNNIVLSDGDGNPRLFINSVGSVAIGDPAPTRHGITTKALIVNTSTTTGDFALHVGRLTGGAENVVCISNGNGKVGSITTSGSSTAYNTSSDYRLKENVDYDWDATTRLKQLKPARFNWISDDTDTLIDGFIAHEVTTVVPEAINGTKDAMMDEEYEVTPAVLDEDGAVVTEAVMGTRSAPIYQGIDQAKLVPLLVKTIQELEARITALEGA